MKMMLYNQNTLIQQARQFFYSYRDDIKMTDQRMTYINGLTLILIDDTRSYLAVKNRS